VIMLDDSASRAIRRHAAAAYPEECCGAIVGRADGSLRTVTAAWPLTNTSADDRQHRYTIASDEYLVVERRARDEGLALLGFYHSHPDAPAAPSQFDLLHAWPNVDYLIVSVVRAAAADVTCWRLRDDRAGFAREEIQWRPES
jgi:proteasome lid subunit RPN8/RPN11